MDMVVDEVETFARPEPRAFPKNWKMPDALVTHRFIYRRKDECGLVLHLLSPRAFELFPEAPTEGPLKGLLWFPEKEIGNLCAFEEEHDLYFHGIV
jgi:hypothetical protein